MRPKFRLFAGPNGSGKTSLFEYLKNDGIIHTELYINADRFERDLKSNLIFNYNAYRVKVSQDEFLDYIKSSTLYAKMPNKNFIQKITIISGVLKFNLSVEEINSYHASFVASYLAERLLDTRQSFCFETVMSHESKIQLLKSARSSGYKTYLYFVYTDNPELNVFRVKLRAKLGLHDVNSDVIKDRYRRSFALLPLALKTAERAYVINNSKDFNVVAEKTDDALHIRNGISE